MRPPEARQISMARSRAQSECGELSTGTKTSLYGMTPPSAVMGSLYGFSELLGFFFSADHQSWRCAKTPAHQLPVNSRALHLLPAPRLLDRARESSIWSRSRVRARSCSSRETAKSRHSITFARDMTRRER